MYFALEANERKLKQSMAIYFHEADYTPDYGSEQRVVRAVQHDRSEIKSSMLSVVDMRKMCVRKLCI